MPKYDSITDLYKGMQKGDFDEEALQIQVDNDGTFFCLIGNDGEITNEIRVAGAEGYRDVVELYSLLFPKSDVDWV